MAKIGPKERELRRQRESKKVIPVQRSTNLNDEEKGRLTELCGVVKRGLQTFVEVGSALMEIREFRLYRERCSTFEAFVQIEFGMSRSYAYRQISAAETAELLSPRGDIALSDKVAPESEKQVRSLSRLPKEKRSRAWQEAVGDANGKQPTAEQVEKAVERQKPRKATSSRKAIPPRLHTATDEPDPVAEWQRLGKENDQLREQIELLTTTATTPQKQIAKLQDRIVRLDGRLQQEIKTREEAEKQARYGTALLKKIRAALKVDKNVEIMAAIADLKR